MRIISVIFVTLVSMLSMQSRTKSGCPDRISSSADGSYNCTLASIWHSGYISEKCFFRHEAFGVPTSSLVATACRFSDESETFQHITSSMLMSTYFGCSILMQKHNISMRISYCHKSLPGYALYALIHRK